MALKLLESTLVVSAICFNQDQGCFAVAHSLGFVVYNTNPVEIRVTRQFDSPLACASMLHRTNYLALIGQLPPADSSSKPIVSCNRVTIWDDLKRKPLLVFDFDSPVLGVLLLRMRIVVVLENQLRVYGFSSPPKHIATYDTTMNPYGLADMLVTGLLPVLAFPARALGQVQIVDVLGEKSQFNRIIKAHKSAIRCLVLNRLGLLVATALETGTLIRVHTTATLALAYEFRRGLDRAVIHLISFSPNDRRLAVLLDKLLHIFNLEDAANRHHVLKALPFLYFNLTWLCCLIATGRHDGAIGWAGDSVIIVWKEKVWEKYDITKVSSSTWHWEQPDTEAWQVSRSAWKRLDF